MATTLQEIVATIKAANIVPSTKVNYGYSDGLAVPYISILDFTSEQTYDTSGPTLKESHFKVLVVDKGCDSVEDLGLLVNNLIDNSTNLTPKCMRCFQEGYRVGQMDEKLYQFGCEINYLLTEDLK